MLGEEASDRTVLRVTGADRVSFLQGMVTNDMRKLAQGALYAAILSPQGKYLADFFLIADGESLLLDVKSDLAPGLLQRLSMYKLRANVEIAPSGLSVQRGLGGAPEGAVADPRHTAMGWRRYSAEAGADAEIDWDALRVTLGVPETGIELIPQSSFILEFGFERLHGVDHRKGCYVGQEVTARMKHKTELRKGLARVIVSGEAAPGTRIDAPDGKEAGVLHTRSGDRALAYLRFDRAEGAMTAGSAIVTLLPDDQI
jgi:folate-binding protein YgfZ